MSAYIYFIERDVVFTPSAVSDKGEHVTIKMVSMRPLLRRHQHNSDTGQCEIAVHIPVNYDEKFWVYIYSDKHPRQKIQGCTCLEVYVEDGIITDIIPIREGRPEELNPAGINIKFPSGEYCDSNYEWHKYPMSAPANSWFVWLP